MNSYDRTDFEMLKSVDIKNVDKGSLIDLDVVQIDDTRPVSERILSFLQQVKNPYCFRIGDVAVKVNYKPDGPSFQQNFEDLLRTAERQVMEMYDSHRLIQKNMLYYIRTKLSYLALLNAYRHV